MKYLLSLLGLTLIMVGCARNTPSPQTTNDNITMQSTQSSKPSEQEIDFTSLNPKFNFSAHIPSAWEVSYAPNIEAINIYDPTLPGSTLEQSQIFIRYFEASQFLTLTSVTILKRENLTINGHAAVRYEILKKPNAPNFAFQPSWRNYQHSVTDIRATINSPSVFYVIAKSPSLNEDIYSNFLQSLKLK